MPRTDHAYWQRLRKDVPSNIAAVAVLLCLVLAIVSLSVAFPGRARSTEPGSAWSLALALPLGWWARGLFRFEAPTIRMMRPALLMGTLVCAADAALTRRDATANLVLLTLAAACACVGELAYRRSMLKREGPVR